jgi:hypothetical protein
MKSTIARRRRGLWANQEEEATEKRARQEVAKKQIQEVLRLRAAEVEELRTQNQAIKLEQEGDAENAKTPVRLSGAVVGQGPQQHSPEGWRLSRNQERHANEIGHPKPGGIHPKSPSKLILLFRTAPLS